MHERGIVIHVTDLDVSTPYRASGDWLADILAKLRDAAEAIFERQYDEALMQANAVRRAPYLSMGFATLVQPFPNSDPDRHHDFDVHAVMHV
jgi:hypothetical protein